MVVPTVTSILTLSLNRFVNSFGYVSLFPFLLKLVSPSSEQLGSTLDRLANKSVGHMISRDK